MSVEVLLTVKNWNNPDVLQWLNSEANRGTSTLWTTYYSAINKKGCTSATDNDPIHLRGVMMSDRS